MDGEVVLEVILERVVMQEMQLASSLASCASSWHLARYIVGTLPGIDTQGSYNSVARVATIQLPGIVLKVSRKKREYVLSKECSQRFRNRLATAWYSGV